MALWVSVVTNNIVYDTIWVEIPYMSVFCDEDPSEKYEKNLLYLETPKYL